MKFATTKQRILQFIDYKEINVPTFLKETGIKRGFLDSDKLGSSVSDVFIATIIATYPEINTDWLITGKGDMLKERSNQSDSVFVPEIAHYKLKTDGNGLLHQQIPLYELEASAGLTTLFSSDIKQIPIDFISVPNAPKCDGAIFVRGDSMYPILKAGDIVCYKTIHSIENVYYGEMYLIDIDVEGDQYLTFKYIQKSNKGDDYLYLVSHNPHHAPKDVLKVDIRAIALVKLSIRYNTNA